MRTTNLVITNNQKKNKKAFLQFFYVPKEFLENIFKKNTIEYTPQISYNSAQIHRYSELGFDP